MQQRTIFKLHWDSICGDLLYERTLNRTLNSWTIFLYALTLGYLYFSNSLKLFKGFDDEEMEKYFGNIVKFLVLCAYGVALVLIMIPVLLANGLPGSRTFSTKLAILVSTLGSVAIILVIWINLWDQGVDYDALQGGDSALVWLPVLAITFFVLFLIWALGFTFYYTSYFDTAVSKNIRHVKSLLLGKRQKDDNNPDFWGMNDIIDSKHLVHSDYTLLDVILKFKYKYILWDIWHHTPPLLQIGACAGLFCTIYYESLLNDLTVIHTTWGDLTDSLRTGVVLNGTSIDAWLDEYTKLYKEEYDEYRTAWNITVRLSISLAAMLSMVSLFLPILSSVGYRFNLRFGLWRRNYRSYISKPILYYISAYPGNQIGVVVLAFTLLVFIFIIALFFVIHKPARNYIISNYSGLFVTFAIAVAVKIGFVKFIFMLLVGDHRGNIRNPHTFSIAFIAYLFLNIMYGALAAFIRLAVLISWSVFAIFRMDETPLPKILSSVDSPYYSFAAYMYYEHALKNPILRCAIYCFAGSEIERHEDPTLLRFIQHPVDTVRNASSSATAVKVYLAAEPKKDKTTAVQVRAVSDRDGTAVEASIRARTRWFLAYTLIRNPELVHLRHREVHIYVDPDDDNADASGDQTTARKDVRVKQDEQEMDNLKRGNDHLV